MPPPARAEIEPERILLVRPSALGDVCRTVPVLASLRRRWPGARIDWLVRDVFAPAVRAHPALTGVVPFARDRLAGWWRGGAAAGELRAFLRGLRVTRYDLALDAQGLLRSGLFVRATGAPRRIGHANAAEWASIFYTRGDAPRVPLSVHTVDRMLALAAAAGAAPVADMRLYTPAEDQATLDHRLRGARYALLAPTSRWPGKRWPPDRFAALAGAILGERAADVVAVVGGPGEREQCGPLLDLAARDPRVVDLIGRTTVGGLMAAVESAAVVVANDSAVIHMAVGFNRPMVALFGPTEVSRVGPYRREHDVLQRVGPGDRLDHKNESLGAALMERITVHEATAATLSRLADPASGRT